MKPIFFCLLIIASFNLYAQTGIGTTTPDASAKLEVSATNKGFLPPRVALTATNSASPITNPANGLMVFNTVTAGASPFQVVPGYYYWDATGAKWVSLSTTVGNVQNQGVFRSSSNTSGGAAVSSWSSRFNNIASTDLTITSNTTFALSNGIYKLEWALPFQQANTYNIIQLQEYTSGSWNMFLSDGGFANLGNGGGTDWGGGTFAADVVDCTSGTRTFRLANVDGSGRTLYNGATFTITKLNPSSTTSTTADNLGNHTATKNISLSGNYLSNDGGNEGIRVDNSGNVGIGTATPSQVLDVNGNVNVTGKINLTDPSGNVATKVVAFVNAGTFLTLDNLKVSVTTGGNRGLSVGAVSTSFTANISGWYGLYGGGSGYSAANISYTTTASTSAFGWSFATEGDTAQYQILDKTNSRMYRVTMMIGSSYNNNLITIERLL